MNRVSRPRVVQEGVNTKNMGGVEKGWVCKVKRVDVCKVKRVDKGE